MNFLFINLFLFHSLIADQSFSLPQRRFRREDGLTLLIRNSFRYFGEYLATGVYDLRIPSLDPITVPRNISLKTQTDTTQLDGQVANIEVSGLSNVSLSDVDLNLENQRLDMNFTIRKLRVEGIYFVDGLFQHIFPIKGDGDFWIGVDPLVAKVSVKTKVDEDKKFLIVDQYRIEFFALGLTQNFSNLLGGGNIGTLANYFVGRLGQTVTDRLHPFLKRSFGEAIRRKLSQTLKKIAFNNPNKRSVTTFTERDKRAIEIFNEYFDEVLKNIREFVSSRHLDPIPIDDWGSDLFTNGTLSGLNTIKRASDARISLEGDDVSIDVQLQFNNLTVMYNWNATLWLEFGGEVEMDVDHIVIHVIVKTNLTRRPPVVTVDKVNTTEVGEIEFRTKGLGPFNVLVDTFVNSFSMDFAISFAEILEKPICRILESTLNRFLVEKNRN